MRVRDLVPFALVTAAVGCAAMSDSPTEPAAPTAPRMFGFQAGSPAPPPPVDTGVAVASGDGAYAGVARYFINKSTHTLWIDFDDAALGEETANARLQVNLATGASKGVGTLTLSNNVPLQLSRVTLPVEAGEVVSQRCVEAASEKGFPDNLVAYTRGEDPDDCRVASFLVDGQPAGSILLNAVVPILRAASPQ